MSASEPFVSLLGGLTLPLAPVLLALDLEQRGLSLTFEDNDVLIVGPRERLTNDDRTLIRRWKLHLLALLAYNAGSQDRTQ